jgi:curved DNA-binding protein CbpA
MKLGLQFGASLEECKIARTKLLKQYHPDRVTDEMQKQKYTIMSQLVNESFQRIKEYYEKQ